MPVAPLEKLLVDARNAVKQRRPCWTSCRADRIMLQIFRARLEGSTRYILGRRGRQRVYVRDRRSVREGYRGALRATTPIAVSVMQYPSATRPNTAEKDWLSPVPFPCTSHPLFACEQKHNKRRGAVALTVCPM